MAPFNPTPDQTPPFLTAGILGAPDVAHGFFSRQGGVSKGAYASLNTGPGSDDDPDAIVENRRRCAGALGIGEDRLINAYQINSPDVITVKGSWGCGPEKGDALVTTTPGLAIGVLTADCMPFLFLDPHARVVAAAHAGWRGALAGILENTVAAMVRAGAHVENICAAAGPCLRQPNFEVGLDLVHAFTTRHPASDRFFSPGVSGEKRQLDLAGFSAWRLRNAGVKKFEDLGVCTLANPDRYFSYRAAMRAGQASYGRNLSAIALL